MGRKCSVYNCRTGYVSQKVEEKVTVYSFPKDNDERRAWIPVPKTALLSSDGKLRNCHLNSEVGKKYVNQRNNRRRRGWG